MVRVLLPGSRTPMNTGPPVAVPFTSTSWNLSAVGTSAENFPSGCTAAAPASVTTWTCSGFSGEPAGMFTTPLTFCTVKLRARAVKPTGASVPTVAVTTFGPAAVPTVSVVDAWPCASVVLVAGLTLPPPSAAAQLTDAPTTGFPAALVTRTTSGTGSCSPGPARWSSPLTATICAGPVGCGGGLGASDGESEHAARKSATQARATRRTAPTPRRRRTVSGGCMRRFPP